MTVDRARITITDVVYILIALAALSGLWPAYSTVLDKAAADLPRGEELLLSTLLPVALLIILAVIYVDARGGAG